MSITVGELLGLPHLHMKLLAGAAGLDREISWVHTSDLPQPWGWLGFGELLLTNGTGLSPEGPEQARFVERLAGAGASGLGIGLGMSGPPLTGQLHERADALRLPVVTVPYSMQFTAVVRAVADANTGEQARLYELLRTSVLTGRSVPELFRKLGLELLPHHIATGGALEIAQLTAAQERRRRLGEQLLGQLLDRRVTTEAAAAQLAETGVDLAACVLAVTRTGRDGTGTQHGAGAQARTADARIHRKLARAGVPHLLLERDGLLQVVLPADQVTACLLPEIPGPPGDGPAMGASGSIGAVHRLPDAAHEARWALAAAESERRPLVRYGEETASLLPRSAAEAQALVGRILGPLLRHDADHGTAYLDTLRALLDHDRSWQRAAAAVHVHKQTLGYRLRKIEQLTGRGVTRTEHLAEWWFALRAHDLLTGRHLQ
jgi:purine catabolism regulator